MIHNFSNVNSAIDTANSLTPSENAQAEARRITYEVEMRRKTAEYYEYLRKEEYEKRAAMENSVYSHIGSNFGGVA